jgi:hypothetical protein
LSIAITQVIEDMPIHKQLRKRVDARSEDAVNEDVADSKPNPLQQQQPPPPEETSVISDDCSDRGSRKPAYRIGTKVKKVRDFFPLLVVFINTAQRLRLAACMKVPFNWRATLV